MTLRVATWNLERKRPTTPTGSAALKRLRLEAPDLVFATEARTDSFTGHVATSTYVPARSHADDVPGRQVLEFPSVVGRGPPDPPKGAPSDRLELPAWPDGGSRMPRLAFTFDPPMSLGYERCSWGGPLSDAVLSRPKESPEGEF